MNRPTLVNAQPRFEEPSGDERCDASGGADRGGHRAKRSGEGATSKTAPPPRTAAASKASMAASSASVRAVAGQGVSAQLAELTTLGMPPLRSEWRRLFRREPPRLSRDQMMRMIAYRIQEDAFGGLPTAVERRLAKLTGTFKSEGRIVAPPPPKVKPGARLMREWRGRTHVVSVIAGGFEYEGKTFPSLTAIAVEITGAHWSGPRFFGLVRRRGVNEAGASASSEIDGEADEAEAELVA
jgi:Protein of unknown function (DUF2924)